MTDRERWIVYPLLFLALAVGLRDKLTQSVRAERLECSTLVFSGADKKPLLILTPEAYVQTDGKGEVAGLAMLDGQQKRIADLGAVIQCQAVQAQGVQCRGLLAKEISAGKVFSQDLVKCQTLVVTDAKDRPLVAAGGVTVKTPQQPPRTVGQVTVYGANGQQAVGISTDARGATGVVSTHDPRGVPLAIMASNAWGGLLRIVDYEKTLALNLGNFGTDRLSGLVAEDNQGQVSKLHDSLITRPQPQSQSQQELGPGPPEPALEPAEANP